MLLALLLSEHELRSVAQLVEQPSPKRPVGGSNPLAPVKPLESWIPEAFLRQA